MRGPVLLRHPDCLLLDESDRLEFSRRNCGRDERLRGTLDALCCADVAARAYEKGEEEWLRT